MNKANPTIPLILASASPRRRQLLADAGLDLEVVLPPLEELKNGLPSLTPAQKAEALAYYKARSVSQLRPNCYVLAADTIVSVGGEIMGKAANADEARRMLKTLSATRHAVITGVALLGPAGERLIASDTTYVTMKSMTDEDIDQYVASDEWIDKAGAYAIQETADRFVEKLEGHFDNVVGLPVGLVLRMIREMREHPETHRTR